MISWSSVAPKHASLFLLGIIYLGFISLGLPDGTFGVAWPQMHTALDVPIGVAGTVMVVGTVLAALSGFSSGKIIARFKTAPVVVVSCALTATGLMVLAQAKGFVWLMLAAVPLGLGAGAVDAGLNGYVARHYTGRQMNWLHACWGIGATCGPLIMAYALGHAVGWRGGYFALSIAQFSLAAIFLFTLRLWDAPPPERPLTTVEAASGRVPTALANSGAGWLSVSTIALYVAVEATAGLWMGSILVVSRGITQESAGICVAAYYGSITSGRILVGIVVDRWGNRQLVTIGSAIALVGIILFGIAATTAAATIAVVLLGLGLAPIYPCLMHEVPRRFAPESVQVVIGRQSGAANLGGAFLPAAAGSLAQVSLESIVWVVMGSVLVFMAAIHRLNRIT